MGAADARSCEHNEGEEGKGREGVIEILPERERPDDGPAMTLPFASKGRAALATPSLCLSWGLPLACPPPYSPRLSPRFPGLALGEGADG